MVATVRKQQLGVGSPGTRNGPRVLRDQGRRGTTLEPHVGALPDKSVAD